MKVSKQDIGGELISIITKGMYADPKDALREYVQNGVDANAETITIRIKSNSIIIIDDGHGMDMNVMRRAVRVGISDKNPKKSVGFMGIGLYSSFHLCDILSIYSKVKDGSPYKLVFHFDQMRQRLEQQKELRISGKSNIEQIDLLTLLETTIEFQELKVEDFPKTGTRVEMKGLETNFFMSLSRYQEVADYLERVIPLPFSPEFRHGEKIQTHIEKVCKKNGAPFKTINLNLDINGSENKLYRPYKDSDFAESKHPEYHPLDPEYYELLSPEEGFIGICWACLNSGRSTIPNAKVRGFIIKKQGFTVGKREDLVVHWGRPTYFNRYIGEFIAVHPKLLPNGPRSDFEYSSIRTTFYGLIKNIASLQNKRADHYQEMGKAEEQLNDFISRYNEMTVQVPFFQDNGDKLLDYFQELRDIQDKLESKINGDKFAEKNKPKAGEALKGVMQLLNEIKVLLDIKKSRKKTTLSKKSNTTADKIITPISYKESEPAAQSLYDIFVLLGLEVNDDVKSILELIDEKYIKSTSQSSDDYLKKIQDLRDDIEDLYESE